MEVAQTGSVAGGISISVFFPCLDDGDAVRNYPNRAIRMLWWEEVFRVAGRNINLVGHHMWPGFANEESRCRNKSGGFMRSGQGVTTDDFRILARELRHIVEHSTNPDVKAKFKHFRWGLTIRGSKNTTRHTCDEAAPAMHRLWMRIDRTVPGFTCYIDIGLEFVPRAGVLSAWRRDSHREIMEAVLQIDGTEARKVTGMEVDLLALMTELAGFRAVIPNTVDSLFDIVYIQAYTTEKKETYRPDLTFNTRNLTPVNMVFPKAMKHVQDLYDICDRCRRDTEYVGAARIEARVHYHDAPSVLVDDSIGTWKGSLSQMTSRLYW
jgi:hypothetical protein